MVWTAMSIDRSYNDAPDKIVLTSLALPYAMMPDYASPEEIARHDGYGWCEGNVSYSASGKLRAITDDDGIVVRLGPDLLWMLRIER